jgi:hypothetical protein
MCSHIWNNVIATDATKQEHIKKSVTLHAIDFLNIPHSNTFELLKVLVIRCRKYQPDDFYVSLSGFKMYRDMLHIIPVSEFCFQY